MTIPLDGGCLCGTVRYRITAPPLASGTCQCRTCRKASAGAIVPWIQVNAENLSFIAGKPIEFRSSPSVIRTFCGRCGTPLTYWRTDYGPAIDVTACSLDVPDAFPPMAHVWTSHALGWLKLADDLPRFEESPPAV